VKDNPFDGADSRLPFLPSSSLEKNSRRKKGRAFTTGIKRGKNFQRGGGKKSCRTEIGALQSVFGREEGCATYCGVPKSAPREARLN